MKIAVKLLPVSFVVFLSYYYISRERDFLKEG